MTSTLPQPHGDVFQRVQAADVDSAVLESLKTAIDNFCCRYSYDDAEPLRDEATTWLRAIEHALELSRDTPNRRELLVMGGWLALLTGCVEYDLNRPSIAEALRLTARHLAIEAGNNEILGWTYEMSAWFANTQSRFADAITAARAGQELGPKHGVYVQLVAQEARARARLGDFDGLRELLDRGQTALSHLYGSADPDHHFHIDAPKWDLFAMDVFRLAGDNDPAEKHAHVVIADAERFNHAPMRLAEAELTLATVASRKGELEQAVHLGAKALGHSRQSLPSITIMAEDFNSELTNRYPNETTTAEFRELLRSLYA